MNAGCSQMVSSSKLAMYDLDVNKASNKQFLNAALDVLMYNVLDVNHRLASPRV